MADPNIHMTVGLKAAMKSPQPTASFTIHAKITKPYIWLMKCRYIWAVIRSKPSV
jgi:hypothetical protein